jgi:hypothetical protein
LPTSGADVVVLSALLADFPRDERIAILGHARRALRGEGVVVIAETLLDENLAGPPKATVLSLLMLAAMRGEQLTFGQIATELAEVGFGPPRCVRGAPRDLVIAAAP